jgi:hypothetical protein
LLEFKDVLSKDELSINLIAYFVDMDLIFSFTSIIFTGLMVW